MKKFMIFAAAVVIMLLIADHLYYYTGTLYISHTGRAEYFSKAEGDCLYLDRGDGFEVFDIKGVNLGLGIPGYFATEKGIAKEDYLRWFAQIQALGANVIRLYTLAGDAFYEAFYEYNIDNPNPLFLLHGVQVDEYLINSIYSALDEEFSAPFLEECRVTVDVIHGRYKESSKERLFPISYHRDISPWVYGYILGVDWESTLISYTDHSFEQLPQLAGTFFYTENASNFEIFLASVAEEVARYEQEKYGAQRVIAFSNRAETDPFEYTTEIARYFGKTASLDVEHIRCTDIFAPGQFASYHVYPYYPDYYYFLQSHEENTYLQYLTTLNDHHTVPVVISEFGIPSSRGMASSDEMGRHQGNIDEVEQGNALVSMYRDIVNAGSAGAIVFAWQDEWFKHCWNTIHATDLKSTAYWCDAQTSSQHYGLLSFDPGVEKSICYVDGDRSDWEEDETVFRTGDISLSVKYDEKYIYFLVEKEGYVLGDPLYIPIDTTPKSGAVYAENFGIAMNKAADFIVEINDTDNSRVWVQEYYDILGALYFDKITPQNIFSKVFPLSDSSRFEKINLLLRNTIYYRKTPNGDVQLTFYEYNELDPNAYHVEESYETGKLVYGNANPNADNFNSLADFCAGEGFVEFKLSWGLLNFADPSQMQIHDDYYECYGVEQFTIDSMNVGVGDGSGSIEMVRVPLKPLGKYPAYHERLKKSYFILQNEWNMP